MIAVIVMEIRADTHDEAQEIAVEQLRYQLERRWDASDQTCERLLAWLRNPSAGGATR